jgi:hypothetical protein
MLAPVPGQHAYCTLFDQRYLPQAVEMVDSLRRTGAPFALRTVCMDAESRRVVERLGLPGVTVVPIEEVERFEPALGELRARRSWAAYCWTATPAVCRYLLATEPGLDALTYLDADLSFAADPQPLHDALGDGAVLLVATRTTPELVERLGAFNVGWLTLRADARARRALEWWWQRCVEWCDDRPQPGRYGDQKYLDDWPQRFEGVVVCSDAQVCVAPWNETLHELTRRADGTVLVDGEPMVFFHHSGLRLHRATPAARALARAGALRLTGDLAWSTVGGASDAAVELVWEPYVARVARARRRLVEAGAASDVGLVPLGPRGAAGELLRARLPTGTRRAYRRLPFGLRHRVRRWLSA